MLDDLRSSGMQPQGATCVSLVKSLTLAGRQEQAAQTFKVLESDGVKMDVEAYNSLMAAFSSEADWQRVWAVMSTMRTSGIVPDTVSYNILLKACARYGDHTTVPHLMLHTLNIFKQAYFRGF